MRILITIFLLINVIQLSAQTIYTIAGKGKPGYKDKVPAPASLLYHPAGIAADEMGNLYIADCYNNRIRKITHKENDELYKESIITTIAGNGSHGYNGNDIKAIKASLSMPMGVFPMVIEEKGKKYIEVYFTDTKNNQVRKINKNGFIRRVAGRLKAGYGGDGGPAINAILAEPTGIFIDKNRNIYIADTYNNRVRVIYNHGKVAGLNIKNPKKGYIYTIAGNGKEGCGGDGGPSTKAEVGKPYDVCVDKEGNVYIAQRVECVIRKVDIKTGKIETVAGIGGKCGYNGDYTYATKERLNQPFGVWIDDLLNIYIADANNHRIRIVNPSGYIKTLAGTGQTGYKGDGGPAKTAWLSAPWDITGYKNYLFFSDSMNHVIRMIILKKENK